ncbi:hypothetical protein [Deinococcus cellulosilyticus]|uniref:Uncharacterized protein n=1 Tax=Deinococcus cellulosilyticus (strain DSM 18568 / NBRC 106333 / KACC 11606 / 5516J-15) TaxID=1223518 RepID=A0A511N614_DEIC1|nr:hypothetical protein [Deinococcus cellulosilyticus]GEM47851.1 hypothetical protein DC3_34860 [Deinococcus cellulosilyticus NBRC 106333 = KACC 11606]
MKKWLLLLLLGFTPVLAHDIEKDGNVGALIHIEPDDAPVVGSNVTWFEVNQKGGIPITLKNCLCTLKVYAGAYKEGAKAQSNPKLLTDKNHLKATIKFPASGAYTLVLSGKPQAGAEFNAFTLQWVVRAEGTGGSEDGHDHSH